MNVKKMRFARMTVVVAAGLLSFAACAGDSDSPRGVAERFLDAHYVRIDLPTARGFTSGLAREKIDREAELTRGQIVDEGTRMPRVHYRLVEERERGNEAVSFVYDATFTVPGDEPLERSLQLTVRRLQGPVWRVTNYQEY